MDAVLAIGRILFALLFISSGINHLTKLEAMTGYAKYKKVPAAKLAVLLSGVMLLLGGVYVALGIYADLGALLMHAFWKETDPTAKMNESIAFFKDLSLAGAALILFAMIASGANIGWHITSAFFNF